MLDLDMEIYVVILFFITTVLIIHLQFYGVNKHQKNHHFLLIKKLKLNYKTAYFNLKNEYIRLLKYIEEDMEFQEKF